MTNEEKIKQRLQDWIDCSKRQYVTTDQQDELMRRISLCTDVMHFIDHMVEADKCKGCNNAKACIICENGDQWAIISPVRYDMETIEKAAKEYADAYPEGSGEGYIVERAYSRGANDALASIIHIMDRYRSPEHAKFIEALETRIEELREEKDD
jgi:hypothetical protein